MNGLPGLLLAGVVIGGCADVDRFGAEAGPARAERADAARVVCAPVAAGARGHLPVFGNVLDLAPSPVACELYAIVNSPLPELIVFDTEAKAELLRVPLPALVTDLDVSPDGASIAVAHGPDHQVSLIDRATWTATTLPTSSDPEHIGIRDDGTAFYVEGDQWCQLWELDLGTGADTPLGPSHYFPGLELDATGNVVYLGESGSSGSQLVAWDVSTPGAATWLGESPYAIAGYGDGHVLAPAGAPHVYYSGFQFDAADVSFLRGSIGERALAGDTAGTFVIGENGVFDAETLRRVADHGLRVSLGALVSDDQEVWLYAENAGGLVYVNVDEWIGGVTLGDREPPPHLLTEYRFDQLVHDPVRDQLYGLDIERQVVAFVDTATMTATHEIVVGSSPTHLSIDPTGTTLYVGHGVTNALAVIDAAAGTLSGWITTSIVPHDVVAMADGKVAINDEDQWTTLQLLDPDGEPVFTSGSYYRGALGATADGRSLFIVEDGISSGEIVRYALLGGTLVEVDSASWSGPSGPVLAKPDGTAVWFDDIGRAVNGATLSNVLYRLGAPARSVSPDGRVVVTERRVYDAATGTPLGALPGRSEVQAIDPTSTVLYVARGNQVHVVDLTQY